MWCGMCGCENPDDSKFCKRCGYAFPSIRQAGGSVAQTQPEVHNTKKEATSEQAQGNSSSSATGNYGVVLFLKACAVMIILVGFIAGICLGQLYGEAHRAASFYYSSEPEFNVWIMFGIWIVSSAYGSILYAYAEITRALRVIEKKMQ